MAVGHKQITGHKKFSVLTIVLLLIPVVLAYFGYAFIPAWWANSEVDEVLRKWANSAYREKDVRALRDGIKKDLKKKGVIVDDANLEILFQEPDKDHIWINFSYERVLDMPFISRDWHTHWEHAIEEDLTRFQW